MSATWGLVAGFYLLIAVVRFIDDKEHDWMPAVNAMLLALLLMRSHD